MGILDHENLGFGEFGVLGMWEFGTLGFSMLENLGHLDFGI